VTERKDSSLPPKQSSLKSIDISALLHRTTV